MEFLNHKITGKLIWILLLVIGGIGFVICRIVISALNKGSAHASINSIKKNPSKARLLSDSLDIPYSKKEQFSLDHYEKLRAYVTSVATLGNYQILYCNSPDRTHLLVFTELSFTDFDVDVTGGASDIKKKAYHNFVLKFDPEKNMLVILSDIHSDVTEKFQKEGFIDAIFNGT